MVIGSQSLGASLKMVRILVSRLSFPSSIKSIAAEAVNCLLMLAIRKTVLGFTLRCVSRFEYP